MLNFKKFFGKGKEEQVVAPKKIKRNTLHKNTYKLKIDGVVTDYEMFSLLKRVPLGVVEKNGKPFGDTSSGFITCVEFENKKVPYFWAWKKEHYVEGDVADLGIAIETALRHDEAKKIWGNTADLIMEYYDKENHDKVVAVLYPAAVDFKEDGDDNNILSKLNNALSHMNHATRNDFIRQINWRYQKLVEYNKNRQK